jgi:DNA-binding NarL/FixJ family response regulator
MAVRIIVCDEVPLVRHALRILLDSAPDMEVVETTGSGMEAIILSRKLRPDVVVTNLRLDGISGLEMIRRLRKEQLDPRPSVVVLSVSDTDDVMGDVMDAGASGILGKDASTADLMSAVRLAAMGQTMLAPAIAERLVSWFRERRGLTEVLVQPLVASLTPREREVMLLTARGLSPEEIASELAIGVATARTHIYRVRCKLGARDRAQLVSFAYRSGLMQPV